MGKTLATLSAASSATATATPANASSVWVSPTPIPKSKVTARTGFRVISSVDELKDHLVKVQRAQDLFSTYSQKQTDSIFAAVAHTASLHRLDLAKLAFEDTGRGCMGEFPFYLLLLPL
jgi:acyl-CoA reductase-like NAD-dependent aldehyde dehydrogenase